MKSTKWETVCLIGGENYRLQSHYDQEGQLLFRVVDPAGRSLLDGREYRTAGGVFAALELRYPNLVRH